MNVAGSRLAIAGLAWNVTVISSSLNPRGDDWHFRLLQVSNLFETTDWIPVQQWKKQTNKNHLDSFRITLLWVEMNIWSSSSSYTHHVHIYICMFFKQTGSDSDFWFRATRAFLFRTVQTWAWMGVRLVFRNTYDKGINFFWGQTRWE